mmetsp:Transcript_46284/g.142764  ORF Transcript_46284/g.142764 Transcript_46284/m.142764 type:complete len:86 (+) Transcript_46284:37-294(+)|eukprot:CAMPEP_0174849942 /NCGR_PEP_ID=MMETSP1114-20130205/18292_1 /TAXON_ID=312471 /ORGANISM="Neobodo designis, Strain CCAP 1951/1" /LENGTH=85 /DNA_ID=CAMNT_0016084359 /DNA_START=38 /DNA_END=295 /DNA_ORIENTATION=+
MPGKAIPVYDRFGFVPLVYRHFLAHGFVRLPLALGAGFTIVSGFEKMAEIKFREWNQGHLEADVWASIEKQVAERKAAAAAEEEE